MNIVDDSYKTLREEGYEGSKSDLVYKKLKDLTGLSSSTPDMWYQWLRSLGYNGSVNDMLNQHLAGKGYGSSLQDALARSFSNRDLYYANEGMTALFDIQRYINVGVATNFEGLFDITRSSSKYVWGTGAQTGQLVEVPPNTPAYQHDPVTGAPLGLSVEGSAVRLNTIAAAPTAAENVTVSAVQHTVSFFGTGTMTLSGAHSATVVGDGAFPARTEYTFTPTAGTLTLTPSGDIQHLQLETGATATSPIIGNEGSQATRAADIVTSDAATFGDWFNASEGTFEIEFDIIGYIGTFNTVLTIDDGSNLNRYLLFIRDNGVATIQPRYNGSVQVIEIGTIVDGFNTITFDYSISTVKVKLNDDEVISSAAENPQPEGLSYARLGRTASGSEVNIIIRSLTFKPKATL